MARGAKKAGVVDTAVVMDEAEELAEIIACFK